MSGEKALFTISEFNAPTKPENGVDVVPLPSYFRGALMYSVAISHIGREPARRSGEYHLCGKMDVLLTNSQRHVMIQVQGSCA
jgi:hypothetical protein